MIPGCAARHFFKSSPQPSPAERHLPLHQHLLPAGFSCSCPAPSVLRGSCSLVHLLQWPCAHPAHQAALGRAVPIKMGLNGQLGRASKSRLSCRASPRVAPARHRRLARSSLSCWEGRNSTPWVCQHCPDARTLGLAPHPNVNAPQRVMAQSCCPSGRAGLRARGSASRVTPGVWLLRQQPQYQSRAPAGPGGDEGRAHTGTAERS